MLINFHTVRWKNLLSTGNAWTEIQLDRSKSTLILGENGSGKSTFIEAIVFALYGKPYRNINKPQLVNSITGKGLLVEVEFSIGTKRYLIRRGVKPAIFEIFADGKLLNQTSDVREYQEILEKNILKLNHKSFCQVVVLGTANFTPFMQLPAHHRREIIEDLLDIQIFSKMSILLKERISQNKTDITANSYDIKLIDEKIKMYKENLANIRQNNDDIIRSRLEQVNLLIDETQELETQIQDISSSIAAQEILVTDYLTIKAKRDKFAATRTDLEQKRNNHQQHISFFHDNDTCPTCTQEIDVDFKEGYVAKRTEKIDALETALAEMGTIIGDLDTKIAEADVIRNQITKTRRECDTLEIKLQAVNRSIASYRSEIEELKTKVKGTDADAAGLIKLHDESAELNVRRESLLKQRSTYELAYAMLRDGGIKTKIVKQYIPVINKLVNKYLAAMDFFVNFELDEKFNEVIKSRFRDEFSYNSFSEGEKSRLDLALLFTWRSIARLRNSAATNLLVLDEVFDSSMDTNGSEELIKILHNFDHDTNVFVISHKSENLYDKFHSAIRFQKTKNFSTMV